MKNFLVIITTILLWFFVALLLEYDFRIKGAAFIMTFSPLQWFVFLLLLWGSISIINVYLFAKKGCYYALSIDRVFTFGDQFQFFMCFIPVTHFFVLINNIIVFFDYKFKEKMKEESEFEKIFNKNTVQDKED